MTSLALLNSPPLTLYRVLWPSRLLCRCENGRVGSLASVDGLLPTTCPRKQRGFTVGSGGVLFGLKSLDKTPPLCLAMLSATAVRSAAAETCGWSVTVAVSSSISVLVRPTPLRVSVEYSPSFVRSSSACAEKVLAACSTRWLRPSMGWGSKKAVVR